MNHKERKFLDASHEASVHPKRYPLGWFAVQIAFARRWAEVSDMSHLEALQSRTSIGNVIPVHRITQEASAQHLYTIFAKQAKSDYVPTHRFGAFDYTHTKWQDREGIKLHFENPKRGTSPLERGAVALRSSELQALFKDVQATCPDASTVDSVSWLRSLPQYQRLFPPGIASAESVMSTDMSFGTNYVWGQFVDRDGQLNTKVAAPFLGAVAATESTQELIDAFPLPAMRVSDDISVYYEHFGIDN